jgi:hypothetical protein
VGAFHSTSTWAPVVGGGLGGAHPWSRSRTGCGHPRAVGPQGGAG